MSERSHDADSHNVVTQPIVVEAVKPALLPDGYDFAYSDIRSAEVAGLIRMIPGEEDVTDDYLPERNADFAKTGGAFIDVGVRTDEGELIGFSTIMRTGKYAEFGDFVVHPGHRGEGVGKALIDERLRIADEQGIVSIAIHDMWPTNTLRTYYVERGFRAITSDVLVRDVRINHLGAASLTTHAA